MPYRVALDESYFQVWFSGVVTGANLRDVADELRAEELERGFVPDRLVDMSDMVATGGMFNLVILAARVRGVQHFPNSFRSAVVAPKLEVAGFARIFRVLTRNSQITVEVFEQREAAEAWLRSPPDTASETSLTIT
jgi:hypothetical protein